MMNTLNKMVFIYYLCDSLSHLQNYWLKMLIHPERMKVTTRLVLGKATQVFLLPNLQQVMVELIALSVFKVVQKYPALNQ